MGILAFGKKYVYQGNVAANNYSINNEQSFVNQPEQSMFSQLNPDNICSSCGTPVNPGDKFCKTCGKQL